MEPISTLALEIQPQIEAFMAQKAAAAAASDSATAQDGADDLAAAISYGIAKAWSSGTLQSAMSGWVVPPSGGPVGGTFFSTLKPVATEV